MKRTKGKVLSVLLTLLMLVSLFPVVALAAEGGENPVAQIELTKYDTLNEAVEAAAAEKDKSEPVVIKLLRDVNDGSGVIVPEKSNIVFDFASHTYRVTGNYAGSTGTETQCFQLLKDSTIVMKNGTIIGDGDNCRMMIQNYSNLTLDHMTLDATQGQNRILYTLSNNNGDTKITGGTKIVAAPGKVAFDVCSFSSYPSVSVTVDDATIVGDVEWSGQNGEKYTSALTVKGGTFDGEFKVLDGYTPNIEVTGGNFTNPPADVTVPDTVPVATITVDGTTTTVIGNSKIQSAIQLAGRTAEVDVKSGNLDIFGIKCGVTFTNSGTGTVKVDGVIGINLAPGEKGTIVHVRGWTEGKDATCTQEGIQVLYKCRICNGYFEDEEMTVEVEHPGEWRNDPAHILPKLPHTPDEHGWYSDEYGHFHQCSVCGAIFDEQEHTFEMVIDKEPTATAEGSGHQHCTICGYDGPAVVLPVHTHKAVLVPGKEATTTATGLKPYYFCEGCNKNFEDEACTKEITGDLDAWRVIPVKSPNTPATGDSTQIVLYAGLLFVAVLGTVVVYKRRDRQV